MLFSALTDMAALLRDPRWSELAHDTVSHVVIMGGLIEAEDGELLADAGATNNTYDPESAAMVYGSLIKDDGLGKNSPLRTLTLTLILTLTLTLTLSLSLTAPSLTLTHPN